MENFILCEVVLSLLVLEGADLEVIGDKVKQFFDRNRLNKLWNNKKGPNKFAKLIGLKQKYDKKDKCLIYSFNSRWTANQRTYVFSN